MANYDCAMKNTILSLCLLLLVTSTRANDLVEISKSIVINVHQEAVFDHVKDTTNDHTWRNEVNSMTADGDFEVGTRYTEDAHIGLQRNFITTTVLKELQDLQLAYYETPQDAKYFLSSSRNVERLNDRQTLFTYIVKFDPKMSKETLGQYYSIGFLKLSYGLIMNFYLNNLKNYLE